MGSLGNLSQVGLEADGGAQRAEDMKQWRTGTPAAEAATKKSSKQRSHKRAYSEGNIEKLKLHASGKGDASPNLFRAMVKNKKDMEEFYS